MTPGSFAQAQRGVQRAARRLGVPGVVGLSLVLGALYVWGVSVPALKQSAQQVRAQLARTRVELQAAPRRELTNDEVLARFYAGLAASGERTQLIAQLLQDAKTKGLTVDALQLRTDQQPGSKIVRQVIALPLKGSYKQLRSWLASVLSGDDALSLDELDLHRDGAQNDVLQARVSLSIWMTPRAASEPTDAPGVPAVAGAAPGASPVTLGDRRVAGAWE